MNISYQKARKNLWIKKAGIVLIILCVLTGSFAQEIRIHSTHESLNRILTQLRDEYGLMFSYDDRLLSDFTLSLDRKFSSPVQALDYLLKNLPLRYENINGVYVIYPSALPVKPVQYITGGRIIDAENHESLPYSGIQINGKGMFSDHQGVFSFTSLTDSMFRVRISHLGYYILDTLVSGGTRHIFRLVPSVIAMQEIIILGKPVEKTIQTGSAPGAITLNHKIAYYLPGNGDNSVFNLLRLQPGLLAAGEQSADLMIWGGYPGQSRIIFDGFTLFGMKNFNDNISAINPYMAKDIKVFKGAYGVEYGEKVGGIADISGTEGNRLAPSFQMVLNNMTLNGFASVPLRKKSSLVVAYRQTYYDLYDPFSITSSASGKGRQTGGADYYIVPDYLFRDMNLKYSGEGRKSSYFVSLYGGKDNFGYGINQETAMKRISLQYREENHQAGGTAFYGLRWKEKNTIHFTLSYSHLHTEKDFSQEIYRTGGPNDIHTSSDEHTTNAIHELHSRITGQFNPTERQRIETGAGAVLYQTQNHLNLLGDTLNIKRVLPYFYMQDNISLPAKVSLRPGLRVDFPLAERRPVIQPRLSVSWRINDYLRVNGAMGYYSQSVAKTMLLDTSGNYRLFWTLDKESGAYSLRSSQYSAGLSFARNNLSMSMDGYLKRIDGLTRFMETGSGYQAFEGRSKTLGLDLFLKREFRNMTFWFAYTWSKTEENFSYFEKDAYTPAMHDQRHEIKVAGLARIKSFHFSADYVFGTGFPDPGLLPGTAQYSNPYSRLDASILVQLVNRRFHLDAGFSVLNILNTENINYANFTRIPDEESTSVSFYAEAVPITPALFLKIYL